MNKSKYIQSIKAHELTWDQWDAMLKANERKIEQSKRLSRVVLWLCIVLALSAVILALFSL